MYVFFYFFYTKNMNQILVYNFRKIKDINKKIKNYYKFIFIGILVLICIIVLFYFRQYCVYIEEGKYSKLINNIGKLDEIYKDRNEVYIVNINNYNLNNSGKEKYFCRIKIDKINIDYMVFNEYTDDLLKISLCKFSGNNIKENISIIGHNYENGIFFSNLNKIKVGDKVKIIKDNINYEYNVYKIFEVNEKDLSPLIYNNFPEITLITCNNISKKRYIVKAKR